MHPVAFARTARLHETAAKNGVDPRLKPAAHEFEASLMQELLAPMTKDTLFNNDSNGGGMVMGDAGMDTWSSLGTQALAKALSDAGGLGIATKMIAEVEAEAKEKQDTSKVHSKMETGEIHAGKGISLSAGHTHLHAWSTVRRLP